MKKNIEDLYNLIVDLDTEYFDTRWIHYKGETYVIDGFSIDCNTNEPVVTYHCSGYGFSFSRSWAEWNEQVAPGVHRFVLRSH